MTDTYIIDELVPHSGAMSLLTRVIGHGDDWLEAEVDITQASTFAETDGVPTWIGVEYLAQAIAAFSGVQQRKQAAAPKVGFLLGTRKYEVNKTFFNNGLTVKLRVERDMVGDNGLHVFNGFLTGPDGLQATAKLSVFEPENAQQYMKEKTS